MLPDSQAIQDNDLESVHFKVTFTEPANMTIIDRVRNLLPILDEAYESLLEWTQFVPYNGERIEIKYDRSFFTSKPEKIIGWSGNPIHIKPYPSGVMTDDLYIYFHELTHDFTPTSLWNIWKSSVPSLIEGSADLGAIFLYSHFDRTLQDHGEFLQKTFLLELKHYETSGNPFEQVKWSEDHPDGEYPSDRLTAGILTAIGLRYGFQTYTKLFELAQNETGGLIFDGAQTFEAKMNFLVYFLSLTFNCDFTELFTFWTFPLSVDSDRDGLSDAAEISSMLPISDFDEDGLNDKQELDTKTNPDNPDTDGDRLTDGKEIEIGTNPLAKDSDEDDVNDYDEILLFQTNPLRKDTDNDWWSDNRETSMVRWTDEHVSWLLPLVKNMPSNWWSPNAVLVLAFLLVVVVVLRRRLP